MNIFDEKGANFSLTTIQIIMSVFFIGTLILLLIFK